MTASVTLNGKEVTIPKDFFDVGVKATFDENIQANLTTEDFTFVLDGYNEIIEWIEKGRSGGVGIFEGLPLSISASDSSQNISVFEGVLDLQAGTVIRSNKKEVSAPIRQNENLNQLSDLIEGLDFGYLESIGVISSSDYVNIDYVVNKNDNGLETITTLITIYLLSKQLADTIRDIAKTIANISGIAGAVPGGPIGAVIFAIASAVIQIIYAITLLALIVDFGRDLLNVVVPVKRTGKGMTYLTMIEKVCQHIGYSFNSSVEELNYYTFYPSNPNVDDFGVKNVLKKAGSVSKGIPNVSDFGYVCTDFFSMMRNMFNARFSIVGGVVQFHSENSSYWISQSTYIKPDVIQNISEVPKRYNTDEIKSSIKISFLTDVSDEYTIKNYTGTAYQVLTDAKTVSVLTNKTIKGVDQVNLPTCLGYRKDKLNPFENALVPLANLFDKVSKLFGGGANLAKKIKTRVGVLEISSNNSALPKTLYVKSGKIPSNHRDLLSAKYLWDNFHNEKSFIQNNYSRQRAYEENQVIPFGLSDFVKIINNSYFRDQKGSLGKFVELEWNMSKDTAIVSYWTQETYTSNLVETFIEP